MQNVIRGKGFSVLILGISVTFLVPEIAKISELNIWWEQR